MAEVKVFADAAGLYKAMAESVVALSEESLHARGRFSLVLAGGSTPKGLYEVLAAPPFCNALDWSRTYLFWGDERCVPPDHSDSNYRMAREALIDRVPIPTENLFPINGAIDPQEAALEYAGDVVAFFGDRPPAFDLVLLGMGDDGHTASLFPGTAAVHEKDQWVVAHHVPKLNAWRITLTPPILNAARDVAFLVAGEHKAARVCDVLREELDPDRLPSQAIQPASGRLTWWLDAPAAALLG
jgi:6-phosphogluconolactonase